VHASLDAAGDPDRLFSFVDDLGDYPEWMDLVHRVQEVAGADLPTWDVELRARLGPLARSKRLRMQRTAFDPLARTVTFERSEPDGRSHSAWVLRASVHERGGGSSLDVHLHYGGALWTGGVLERVLAEKIRHGQDRLRELSTG